MLVLDTDVLTLIQRASSPEYDRLLARLLAAPAQPVCATIVSFEEQMRGWLAFIARARVPERLVPAYDRLQALLDDYQTRPVLPFDEPAADHFRHLIRSKVRIGTMDLKIAAITLAHQATLLTRNLTDFCKVSGLSVQDWTA